MKYLNSGIKVLPKDWHEDDERVRRSHNNYNKLNQDLDILEEDARQAYRELDRKSKASADAIKNRLKGASRDNFFTLADEYLTELKYKKQYYSRKQAKVAFDKLKKFHGSNNLPLSLMDVSFMERFQYYLKTHYNNKASTIRKNLGALRITLDKAVKDHLITENPLKSNDFDLVRLNKADSKAKLTLKQIHRLENAQLKKGSNRFHARNAFVLSFYFCGMRFGDVATLTWKNVKDGRLRYQMNKTDNPINIKMPEGAKRVLDYYDQSDHTEDDFIFPFLSELSKEDRKDKAIVRRKISSRNVIVNDQLKKLARQDDVKINQKISMHVARHSFAQYAVDEKEIPTYKMMMLLGHKNIKTTQQYLKTISVRTVDAAMDEIF